MSGDREEDQDQENDDEHIHDATSSNRIHPLGYTHSRCEANLAPVPLQAVLPITLRRSILPTSAR